MQPITAFESQFWAAEVLLKVHRLLRNDATSEQTAEALPRLREAVGFDLAWTSTHVNAIQSVVLACDALALESVRQLEAGAVAA